MGIPKEAAVREHAEGGLRQPCTFCEVPQTPGSSNADEPTSYRLPAEGLAIQADKMPAEGLAIQERNEFLHSQSDDAKTDLDAGQERKEEVAFRCFRNVECVMLLAEDMLLVYGMFPINRLCHFQSQCVIFAVVEHFLFLEV